METFGLRRTQSLRSLSGDVERSWVMSASTRWNRKSVSQLVQHYQSSADLRSLEKVEHKLQVSESCVDGRWRRRETREDVALWGPGGSLNLSRSRSMDLLPQREPAGTKALRALFESKTTLQQDFNSSPQLNSAAATGSKTGRDCPLQGWRSHNTPLRDTTIQRTTKVGGGMATNRFPESCGRTSRYSHDDKYSPPLTKGGTPTRQTRDRISTSSSVRDRSALYLSRAADSTGGSTRPEFIGTPGTKAKNSKMAEPARKITVSHSSHDEDDLPPPPPPPVPPRPLDYAGPSELSSLPVPPPKESFSTFYQQRQKTELKRLFKHIHPDLRASLDDAVDDEIMKAVQPENTQAADAAYQSEVQSMRWIFENWNLDNIGDPHATKKLLYDEEMKGGDVRGTSSMFEHIDSTQQMSAKRQISVRGDVRTSMWLFETQPLDSLNQSIREEGELVEAVLKEPIQTGDVRGTRLLFESKPLSDLGRCNSVEDHSFLRLKSELQEQKGDIQKTVKLFQADPCCAIRDNSGNIHEIKSICREEINSSNISTARWLFETQPLDLINKGTDGVKIIRGISLEEGHRGGVDQKKWMFETQSFDTIQEAVGVDKFEGTVAECAGEADVLNKRKLFEMQPLAALKGDSAEKPLEKEEIVGGDVKTSLWLFETQPMEALNDSYEVGSLRKITLLADEQGEVKGKKQMFESCSTQKTSSFKEQEIEKGDVKGFKNLFETIPLSKIAHSDEIIETEKAIAAGNVKDNKAVFETTPLYAIKDSSGNLHEVTTVSREEFIKGKVQNYKWMFETKPLDKLAEGKGNVEVIKGITRQEDEMGDVKMAKWLFETQTIDGIHSKFNQTEQNASVEEECHKGDVKTCKWLFETQPMDILYDKAEKVNDKEAIDKTDVKSITWLFESQPLDSLSSIKDGEEYNLKLCGTIQDSVKSEVGVQTVKHLFETETLDRIRQDANSEHNVKCVSQVNFQSGDVSRVKELFESQSLDEIGLEMVTKSDEQKQDEYIEKGSVNTYTWMFENCPMNLINKDNVDANTQRVSGAESGDVQNKKFIFETSSLDKIHDQSLELKSDSVEQPTVNVDVKSSTMMFETLPLYAIRDKEGQFHEVTTVKKEEVMSGDVRGARWMFETKPLDAIKAENEVYVIRAVTQEDVNKGDVKSARWKFETQPLDSFTSQDESSVRVTEDLGSSNVQLNKQKFESEQSSNKFVRMVSVTDVQRGDVRTSTWLFENQTIDSLKGEPQEQSPVKTVHREDSQKGDVKRCTWLFESQPLDKIKESENTSVQGTEEEIPKADVKCTTWLFETTPLDKITANSVTDTLSYLYQRSCIHSSGIIIEANESRNVNMAKYLFESNTGVQIQKEEVVGGNIKNIMLQLLLKPNLKPQVSLLREVEKDKVNTTVVELPVYQTATTINLERDQRMQNIVQMISDLLVQDKDSKKGIIMQETSEGQAEMSVYSLIYNYETKTESHVRERGDVKSTIGNLLATANSQRTAASCRVDENEKGNVNLYKSCIEKGDLHYLKSLHAEALGDEVDHSLAEEYIDIVQGDVREAKRSLCQQKEQVERTISDVLPGDVKNTKKVFSSECSLSVDSCVPKEEIIPGDVLSAKQHLAVQPPIMVEKEDIVAGDIKATMQSLERAKQQSMHVEREIIKPGTIYDMDLSAQGPEIEESQLQKEIIISGDVKAAKRSLEMAKQQSMHVEREVIVPGKIYNLNATAQEESSSAVMQSTCSSSSRCQQIKTYPKFQSSAKEMCSACLTPVYPMEKMVANKLILHYNCFCCKHCKKKLSIRNYSSLYGEFYCISHYQQLFKRKGNYDEGFGHKQHKDQWLQKNKGTQEADAVSTPKTTKSNLNRSDSSRESSAGVFLTKSSARELRDNSGADVKGKLKMSWPPEKKSTGVDLMQKTYVKKKISEICKTSTYGMSLADNNQVKINHSVGRKDVTEVTTLSSSFTSGVKERTKMTRYISAEKLTSEEPKPRSDPTKARHFQDSISPRVLKFSSPSPEKGIILPIQKTEQKNVAPTSKTYNNPTSHRLDTNKSKKSVRFAPNVDVAQYDPSTQLTTEAKPEEHSTQLSDQTEQSKVNKSNDLKDVSDKNNFDHSSFEFSKEQSDSEVYLEIHEYKCPGETSKISNQEPDVKVENSQDIPQTDEAILNGGVDKVEESLDTQSFTETCNSTEENVKHQEPSEILQVIPKDSCESDNPSPAEHVSGEEDSLERNKKQFEKSDSANDQENSDSQRKPVARSNSLKGSAKPAEKTKGKLGSWSKGKSPLSKLFTNKTEPKDAKKTDVKPSGGLLGRLFQSSSEKAEDATKSAIQDERIDTTHTDDKKTEEVKEAVTEEMKKEGDMLQVTPQEEEAGEQTKEKSHSAEPNTLDSNKSEAVSTSMPSDLLKTSTSDAQDDLTAPEQTDSNLIGNQVSVLQSSEATGRSVTDPPITVESMSQVSEESINHLAEKSCDEVLTAPFTDDIFVSSAPDEPLVIQINSDKSALMINELLDAPGTEEREPSSSTLFDLNDELPQNSPNPFGPPDTQVIFESPSSLSAAALSEAAPADPFNLFDSQPIPTENEVIHGMTDQLILPNLAPVNQHEDQTSSPPAASSQTSEQVTDFDIFSSSDVLFTQSNAVNVSDQGGADASTNQPSAFPDDIFAFGDISNSTDVFTVLPSTTVTSNSLNDLFGSDTLSTAAPSAQTDIFADDIFASGPQSLTASEPSDVNLFADSLVAYDNNNTEQTADNTVTSSSWMDDLLG